MAEATNAGHETRAERPATANVAMAPASPAWLSPDRANLLLLQRFAGNQAVQRLLTRGGISAVHPHDIHGNQYLRRQLSRSISPSPFALVSVQRQVGEEDNALDAAEQRQIFWDAMQAHQRGDHMVAIDGFQRLLEQPDLSEDVRRDLRHNLMESASALFRQAGEALDAGDVDRAFDAIERLQQLEGMTAQDEALMQENLAMIARAVFSRARQMAREGNVEEAFDSLERANRLPGVSAEDRRVMEENRLDLGRRVFERAREQFREGDVEGAFDNVERAMRVPGMSEQDRQVMQENMIEVGREVMLRAQEQFRAGNYDDALTNVERLMRVPGMSEADREVMLENRAEIAGRLMEEAVAARARGDSERALEIMQRLEQLEGLSPEVDAALDYNLARLLLDLNRPAEAIVYLESALSHAANQQERAEIERLLQEARQAAGQGGGEAQQTTAPGSAGAPPASPGGEAAAGELVGEAAVPGPGGPSAGQTRTAGLWQRAMEHFHLGNYLDALWAFTEVYSGQGVPDFRNRQTLDAVRYIGLCSLELGNYEQARRYLNQYVENGGSRALVAEPLERARQGQEALTQ